MILLEEFFLMDEEVIVYEVIVYECTKGHCHKTIRFLGLDSFMFYFYFCVSQFVLPN